MIMHFKKWQDNSKICTWKMFADSIFGRNFEDLTSTKTSSDKQKTLKKIIWIRFHKGLNPIASHWPVTYLSKWLSSVDSNMFNLYRQAWLIQRYCIKLSTVTVSAVLAKNQQKVPKFEILWKRFIFWNDAKFLTVRHYTSD